MANIPKLLQQLRSPNKNSRFDACEELRVAKSLPDAAILALEDITKDPDPLVADAAHRALQLHRPLPAPGAPHSSAIPSSASDTPSTPAKPTNSTFKWSTFGPHSTPSTPQSHVACSLSGPSFSSSPTSCGLKGVRSST